MSDPALPSPPQRSQRSISPFALGCGLSAAIVAVAMVIAALLVASAMRDAARVASEAAEQVNPASVLSTVLPAATPTIVARPSAILQVRGISDLATVQTLMSTVVEVQKARVGDVIYERLVLIACGRVKAGVRLDQLQPEDVETLEDGRAVRVRLPPAELLDTYLIDDASQRCTTRVYDRTNLLILEESKELESQAREQAVQAIRETALESGILEEARTRAQIAVERVLRAAGYERVEFVD